MSLIRLFRAFPQRQFNESLLDILINLSKTHFFSFPPLAVKKNPSSHRWPHNEKRRSQHYSNGINFHLETLIHEKGKLLTIMEFPALIYSNYIYILVQHLSRGNKRTAHLIQCSVGGKRSHFLRKGQTAPFRVVSVTFKYHYFVSIEFKAK